MKLYNLNFWNTSRNIYKNCEELPLWNFQKYLETNDLKYFTKNLKPQKGLDKVMTNIFDEYMTLSKNQSMFQRIYKSSKIMKLEGKYNCVMLLLKCLYNYEHTNLTKFNELVNELEKWNYRIDRTKDIFSQIEVISQKVQNIKTQIEVLVIELKKDDNIESQSIEKQLITVGRILELKYKLNSKEINLKEWIELQKQAYEQSNRVNSK